MRNDTDAPFGQKKRDWTLIYRVVVVLLALVSAGGVSIALYAGTSYVKEQAGVIIIGTVQPLQDLPPRVRRLEEVSAERAAIIKDITDWRRTKDEVDTRLTILFENQQRQIDRQQLIIDQLGLRTK